MGHESRRNPEQDSFNITASNRRRSRKRENTDPQSSLETRDPKRAPELKVVYSTLRIPEDTSPHQLLLKCRTCGIEFESGFIVNPRSFATSIFRGNIHECPNHHRHSYDKEDYILKKLC
jgi:hypothetical protein